MDQIENPVYSKNVVEFTAVANEYCSFIEQADKFELKDFIDKSHKILPFLYLKAAMLPELDTRYEEFNERFVTENDYNLVHKKILTRLGQYDSYEEVFDPLHQETETPVGASIAENMTDMYQDLKDFILLYQIGSNEVMYEAVWECRQSFEHYWGQRLTNALRALHFLRYSDEEIEADENALPLEENDKEETNLDDIDTQDWFISRRQEDYRDEE